MPAPSAVDICNFALTHCGRSTTQIAALGERSVEARQCNLWYDQCRREALEVMDWSFARRRVQLALDADAAPDEWAFRYQIPADMLTLLIIWNPFMGKAMPSGNFPLGFWNTFMGDLSNAVPYALELSLDGTRQTLLTNQQTPIILYTSDIANPSLFSSQFVNCLSHLIAAKIGYALSGKVSVAQEEAKQFVASLATAGANDASQGVAQPARDGYAVRARL